jgi:ATP-binding protein involved in chromosome partitioning
MPMLTEAAILDALRQVQEPELGRDIVTLDMVKGITIEGTATAFTIELTTPACPLRTRSRATPGPPSRASA